ncbi:alpha-ketoglutarate-dependent dioxygenase AlkB [Archangium sp.]|uniref:alpha-ketoglutarate-dependent dioxygenase AlkB n=1 Tax=Archangium sp. TaxID=1872627 RepID=UPI002D3A4EA5|nr:alpha-ketoglutarate-dependent dioxygenase AlkB [Archangium sp.]HYO57024.1 alpha-ketoglutarate-dependent dioxygenase AlkB [Archangium sp.]
MSEAPEGLRYLPGFLSEEEERVLVDGLCRLAFREIHMHGVVARRTVVHYGWDYGYESWRLTPAPPLPRFLEPLRVRCAEAAGLEPDALEELLVSRYPPGAGIGWHRDAPMFGPCVIGVSLLGAARMRFRREVGGAYQTFALELAPRSAYILAGAARSSWQHTLPSVKSLRYSLSFRTVRTRPEPVVSPPA